MAMRNMDFDEFNRQYYYMYAVVYGNERVHIPESMKFVLGRSHCSDFVISSPNVALRQCEIFCSGGSWILKNLSDEGTCLVGHALVLNDPVTLGSEAILRIQGIYVQFTFELEPARLPMRILRISVLIGERHCSFKAMSEWKDQTDEPIQRITPEGMDKADEDILSACCQSEVPMVLKDDDIHNLTLKYQQALQELKETKSAVRKALVDKGEAELKAALMAQELTKSLENSAKPGSFEEMLESELQCSICNEIIVNAITLFCSHTFCEFCLMKWKKNNSICPMCRRQILFECKTRAIDNLIERVIGTLPDDAQKRRKELLDSRKTARRRAKNQVCTRHSKRLRRAVIDLADPPHEGVLISVNYTNAADETIDITSDDDNN